MLKIWFTFGGCKDGYLEQNVNSYLKCSYLSAHSFLDYLSAQQGTKPWMNSDDQNKNVPAISIIRLGKKALKDPLTSFRPPTLPIRKLIKRNPSSTT